MSATPAIRAAWSGLAANSNKSRGINLRIAILHEPQFAPISQLYNAGSAP